MCKSDIPRYLIFVLLIVGQLLITPVKLPQKGGKLPALQKTAPKDTLELHHDRSDDTRSQNNHQTQLSKLVRSGKAHYIDFLELFLHKAENQKFQNEIFEQKSLSGGARYGNSECSIF